MVPEEYESGIFRWLLQNEASSELLVAGCIDIILLLFMERCLRSAGVRGR